MKTYFECCLSTSNVGFMAPLIKHDMKESEVSRERKSEAVMV